MTYRSFVPDYAVRLLADSAGAPPFVERADAVVLFADIVGFTPMSAALAGAGPSGTEELSDVLNSFFARMTGLVAGYGGTIANFAGDAVTCLFPLRAQARVGTVRRSVQCALDMQAATRGFQTVRTRAGSFSLAMRAGLGAGRVLVAVVGDPATRLEHVLAGEAVDRALAAERRAARSQVVVDATLLVGGHGIELARGPGAAAVAARLSTRPRRAAPRPPAAAAAAAAAAAERLPAFLHPAIAERIRRGQAGLVNEHRTVTMAFIGFPDLVSDHPGAVDRLQRYVATAVRVIDRWGGHLRQVNIGDKGSLLVVAFGAPVGHEDHEEQAVRCCVELLGLPGGPFRAGVTTGCVWCGEVGSDARREYAIVGDPVNLAARLMEAAAPGQALVDRATWEGAHGAAVGSHLGPIAVKGKSESVDVWAVRDIRDRAQTSASPSAAPVLVGRRTELRRIRELVEGVAAGRGAVLGVRGEPGIGKSRLATEALSLARRRGFSTYVGTCRSLSPAFSYLVWRSIWRDLLGLDRFDSFDEQRTALDRRFGERAPLLAAVLNIPVLDSDLTVALDPPTRAKLLHALLLEALRERAGSGPVALLLEDCHWIDQPSQTLLEFLVRNLVDRPVLFVVTARPADTGPRPLDAASRLPHFTGITLGDLPAADAEELARQRVRQLYGPGRDLPGDTVSRVVERSGGNPFYLEELLSLVHARVPGRGDALDLPDSVQRVVMARVDQLSESEKAVMKVASVMGPRFRAEWISACYPAAGPPAEVTRHLQRLDDLRLTRLRATAPEPEHGFRHTITQEVTYQSLTRHFQKQMHERIAGYIEETYEQRLPLVVDVLAYHYGRTDRSDKQRVWFQAAADAAKRLGDRQGLSRTLDRLAYALIQQGSYPQALSVSERHLAIATEAGDLAGMSVAFDHLGLVRVYTGDSADAGDSAGALALLRRSLQAATEAGDRRGATHAANNLGLLYATRGDHVQALACFEQALTVAQEIGYRQMAAVIIGNIGEPYRERGEYEQATSCFAHALRIAAELGDGTSVANRIASLAATGAAQGDVRVAEHRFEHAIRLARTLDAPHFLCEWLHDLAQLLVSGGRLQEAEPLNEEALAVAARHGLPAAGAAREVAALERSWSCTAERAAILDALGQLDPARAETRAAAAALYRELYEHAPNVEYRRAYERLTGGTLPPGPPLPPVPTAAVRGRVDVDDLLRQVEPLVGARAPRPAGS